MRMRDDIDNVYQPLIFEPAPLLDFIYHMLEHASAQIVLIVCTDRSSFVQHLKKSVLNHHRHAFDSHHAEAEIDAEGIDTTPSHPLLERTLRLLAISRKVKLVFCPSVLAFHAYVTTLPLKPQPGNVSGQVPTLLVLNLVRMHRTTASYSAQGLGKALAVIVETAWQMKHRLVFFEYPEAVGDASGRSHNDYEDLFDDGGNTEDELRHDQNGSSPARPQQMQSPENIWQDEVSILNATTKTFGNVGDRSWMGRTVKIGDIAARWCTFATLPSRSPSYNEH